MIASLLDKQNEEDSSSRSFDSFLQTCHKINGKDYLFENEGSAGLYRDTSSYLNKQESLEFVTLDAHWVIQTIPSGLPSERTGSYIFLVDPTYLDPKRELTNDWMRPWSALKPDGKQRVTPKWEKFPSSDAINWVRISKSRHPRFSWIKRMMVFLSTSDGVPSSNIFYQYVIESKQNELSSLDVMRNNGELLDQEETASVSSANELIRGFIQNEVPRFSFSSDRFLSTECSDSLGNVYGSIKEKLKSLKRRYCEAVEVEDMRSLSDKCELLAVLEKETRMKMMELSQDVNRQLQEILAVDEPGLKMPRIKKE